MYELNYDHPVIVAFVGDTHYGKKTDCYDEGKLYQALYRYYSQVASYSKYHKPHIITVLLGDLVDGQSIFPQQPYVTTVQDPIDQVNGLFRIFRQITEELGDRLQFSGFLSVIGNHGRTSKFLPVETSWDRVFYERLSVEQVLGPNLIGATFSQRLVVDLTVKDNHKRFFFHHGHFVRARSTIPYNGIRNKLTRLIAANKLNVDYVVMGHFHILASMPVGSTRVLLNGTSVCGDDYVFDMGERESNEWYAIYIGENSSTVLSIPLYEDL